MKISKFFFLPIGVLCASVFFVVPLSAHADYQASGVLGQTNSFGNPDFSLRLVNNLNGTASTSPNIQGLSYPYGLIVDSIGHRLFVSDNNNHRVLEYNLDANDQIVSYTASHVLGQPDFISKVSTTTQTGLRNPGNMVYDNTTHYLFVINAGQGGSVLIYDLSGGITDGMPASYVLGQADFVTHDATTTPSGFANFALNDIAYDSIHKRLFVPDQSYNRVSIFDLSSGITNGMPASYVLGQADFYSTVAATTQTGMHSPVVSRYDSVHERLFVEEYSNNRVLVYNLAGGITNGMPASNVIGQPDFVSHSAVVSQTGLSTPLSLEYDPGNDRLFVSNDDSSVFFVYDLSGGITDGMPASAVVGATDFTTPGPCSASQSLMCDPENGMQYDTTSNSLFMTDSGNNRLLLWKFVKITTSSLSNSEAGTPYTAPLSATSTQGTLSWSISSGSLPAGLSLAPTTGIISGTPTVAGAYTFTIKATDALSINQTFSDTKQFSLTITSTPASTPVVTPSNGAPVGSFGGGGSLQTPDAYWALVRAQQSGIHSPAGVVSSPTVPVQTPEIANNVPISQTPSNLTYTFNRNLQLHDSGNDVKILQQFLIQQATGPASYKLKLNGTHKTFGVLTYTALKEFQTKNNISPVSGYFGSISRSIVNGMMK